MSQNNLPNNEPSPEALHIIQSAYQDVHGVRDGKKGYRLRERELAQHIDKLIEQAHQRGLEFSLAGTLKEYMQDGRGDLLTMVQGFANIFIACMCVDTNAKRAQIELTDMKVKGESIGDWRVQAVRLKAPKESKDVKN